METNFKEGDVIRIKNLDWYNNNKDKNGSINVTGYSCSFTKALSEFCGKCFVISKIEGTNFYLNDLSFVFYEWMFEPEKYELKPLDITKNSFGTNNPFIFNAAKKPISVCGVISVPLYIAVKIQETPKFQPFQKCLQKILRKGYLILGIVVCFLILQKKANILPLPVCGMNVFLLKETNI